MINPNIVLLASEDAQSQKEAHISSSRKRKRSEEKRMPKRSTNSPDRRSGAEIQPMTKLLTSSYALERFIVSTIFYLCFARSFIYYMRKLRILNSIRSKQKSTTFQHKGTN
jgi:hypothetical protein